MQIVKLVGLKPEENEELEELKTQISKIFRDGVIFDKFEDPDEYEKSTIIDNINVVCCSYRSEEFDVETDLCEKGYLHITEFYRIQSPYELLNFIIIFAEKD